MLLFTSRPSGDFPFQQPAQTQKEQKAWLPPSSPPLQLSAPPLETRFSPGRWSFLQHTEAPVPCTATEVLDFMPSCWPRSQGMQCLAVGAIYQSSARLGLLPCRGLLPGGAHPSWWPPLHLKFQGRRGGRREGLEMMYPNLALFLQKPGAGARGRRRGQWQGGLLACWADALCVLSVAGVGPPGHKPGFTPTVTLGKQLSSVAAEFPHCGKKGAASTAHRVPQPQHCSPRTALSLGGWACTQVWR